MHSVQWQVLTVPHRAQLSRPRRPRAGVSPMSGLAAVLTIACSAAAATEWEGLHRRPSRTHVSTHSTPMGGTAHTQAPSARQHAPRAALHAVCDTPPCAFRCRGARVLPSVRCHAAGSLCTHWCTACRPACPRGLSVCSAPTVLRRRGMLQRCAVNPTHAVRCQTLLAAQTGVSH